MFSIPISCSDVNAFESVYESAVEMWVGYCPLCGKQLVRNGRYVRKTPREIGPFDVQLVCCSERKHGSHALIPCLVLPYERVPAERQELALVEVAEQNHTVEQIAECLDVEPKTVYRWWKSFTERLPDIRYYLANALARCSDLTSWTRESDSSLRGRVKHTLELLSFVRDKLNPRFPYCRLSFLAVLNPLLCLSQEQLLRRKHAAIR